MEHSEQALLSMERNAAPVTMEEQSYLAYLSPVPPQPKGLGPASLWQDSFEAGARLFNQTKSAVPLSHHPLSDLRPATCSDSQNVVPVAAAYCLHGWSLFWLWALTLVIRPDSPILTSQTEEEGFFFNSRLSLFRQ